MDERRNEVIELSLPVNAAYVSAVRLTASSVANRMSFNIDEMEDVKAAVSEACTFVIKKAPIGCLRQFKVMFEPGNNSLTVRIYLDKKLDLSPEEDEMSQMMIRALMDEFEVCDTEDGIQIKMTKYHTEIFL